MNFNLDVNAALDSAIEALKAGLPFGSVFLLVALVMSPWLIPAISKAIAEQRNLSHKREQALLKIRNSVTDRPKRLKPPRQP